MSGRASEPPTTRTSNKSCYCDSIQRYKMQSFEAAERNDVLYGDVLAPIASDERAADDNDEQTDDDAQAYSDVGAHLTGRVS